MRTRLLTGLLALVLLAVPGRAFAQEEGEMAMADYQFFTVFQEMVKPPMIAEYEAVTKELIAAFQQAAVSTEDVSWVAIMSNELGYTYVLPGVGPEDFSSMWESWMGAMNAIGMDNAMALEARGAVTVDHKAMSYITLRPDLSYKPEAVDITADRPYRHYYFFYVIPGQEQNFEGVATEFNQLYTTNDIERGWRLYQYMTGPDLPLYLVVMNAKDESDFHTVSNQISEVIGDQADVLYAKALSYSRRVEEANGWVRPDLSYPVMEMTAAGEE